MSTLPEAVKTKFVELFSVIHHVTEDLQIAGAEAYLIGDFSQVEAINNTCLKLQELEAEIKSVASDFASKHKTHLSVKQAPSKNVTNRTRKPSNGHLRIGISGKVIEEQTIADTFVEVLKVFGFQRVAMLNKIVSAVPLLAKTPNSGYQQQRRVEDWYVTTQVNMKTAPRILKEISKELNVPIQIEAR